MVLNVRSRRFNHTYSTTQRVASSYSRFACPERPWRLVEIDVQGSELAAAAPLLDQLLLPCDSVLDHSIGAALWFAAGAQGAVRTADER